MLTFEQLQFFVILGVKYISRRLWARKMTPKNPEKSQHSLYLWSTIPSVTSENFEKVEIWDTLMPIDRARGQYYDVPFVSKLKMCAERKRTRCALENDDFCAKIQYFGEYWRENGVK